MTADFREVGNFWNSGKKELLRTTNEMQIAVNTLQLTEP